MSKKLAIYGHKKRGQEVIEIFTMLGGNNKYHLRSNSEKHAYLLLKPDRAIGLTEGKKEREYIYFTLDAFLALYPYKLGDKVTTFRNGKAKEGIIKSVTWKFDQIYYFINTVWYDRNEVAPYIPDTPAIDHAKREHALVKEALIARFMQMPKEDLAAALADITASNALFKSAMSSLNTQDLCTLDAKVYINGQKLNTTFLDNTQTANNQ